MLFPGTGMLTCVPPFLSQTLVAHTLKNYIKVAITIFLDFTIIIITIYTQAFLATFVGIPYLTLCAGNTELQVIFITSLSLMTMVIFVMVLTLFVKSLKDDEMQE